jgi:hypothetical protein
MCAVIPAQYKLAPPCRKRHYIIVMLPLLHTTVSLPAVSPPELLIHKRELLAARDTAVHHASGAGRELPLATAGSSLSARQHLPT